MARRAEPTPHVSPARTAISGSTISGTAIPVGPVRTCVGCRARVARSDLLRIVVVGGELLPDVRHRMHGRGAHVHPDPGCVDLAERRKAFPRALRVPGPLGLNQVRAYLELRTRNTGM
ncbi:MULTISPECIES: YlxR family protein [Frankiaceae]|uniref:YlxR family protein n=1 Tax=Frankiaceae TaxID=74712 RepID=UPI0009F81DFD|nr:MULTISPECIES: YlxR family protein [Frankiaceae]